ncbi:MAG TPA: ATP-binding cassette domain-containing protein [Bacteroidales bacterium]|nr:ATP-binding cassette domain-containing protein [Bacteroidales bacterium]
MKYRDFNDKREIVISIENLYKSFEGLDVLNGIDLKLYRRENLTVLGRSGTGKSVLLKIIVGLLKPTSGKVIVLGRQVDKLSSGELNALRLHIGFSFQNSALYDSMNVFQNLAFPLTTNVKGLSKSQVHKAVEEVLNAVELSSKMYNMPDELSGGQRKRVGIARALITKPEIMLYDEPTSGLDPITSVEIIDLINEVQCRYNTSSVIITHDLTCAKNAGNRIAMLDDGKFLKTGTFDDVFSSDDERIQKFFSYNFIQ